jgi:hypothetical protein
MGLVSTDSEAASDPHREPLNNYPALHECIEKREIRATRQHGQGALHAVAARVDARQGQHLPGDHPVAPLFGHKLDVIQGIFHVYQNYQSLLDYSERDALTGLLNRKTFDEQFSRSTADSLARRLRPATTGLAVDEEASAANPLSSNGWPWWTWTISSKSTTALAICMATRC